METRDIQVIGLVTLLVAAALSVDTGSAAPGHITAAASAVTGQAAAHIATPRPRPDYFDLRIDMTDMLGEEALAGPAPEQRIAEARRPADDDLPDRR